MYKNTSSNMQGRASRVSMANVPASEEDVRRYLDDNRSHRERLGDEKNALSIEITRIKAELDIDKKVRFCQIKGWKRNTPQWRRWGEIATRIAEIEKEITSMPKINYVGRIDLIVNLLQKTNPDLFNRLDRMAREQMQRDAELIKVAQQQ